MQRNDCKCGVVRYLYPISEGTADISGATYQIRASDFLIRLGCRFHIFAHGQFVYIVRDFTSVSQR
jgi:hypothetical protein